MASLQGVLANIPGLGGYLAGQQQDQQAQMQQLAQMGALQKIAAGIQAQKDETALKGILAQTGGDVEKAIAGAMQAGNVKVAQSLAPLLKIQQEQKQRKETSQGLAAIFGGGQAPAVEGGMPQQPMGPTGGAVATSPGAPMDKAATISRLERMIPLYANNPSVVTAIQAQISRLSAPDPAPKMRTRVSGLDEIQEEFDPKTQTWKQIGTGPRFNPKAGTSVSVDIGLGKEGSNKVDTGLLDTTAGLMRLAAIESQFKPEYQQFMPRISASWTALKDKAGVGASPQETKFLTEFSSYKRNAINSLNEYIKSITGAAMSEPEAQRILRGMPNPGQGMFDGDSPTEFKAKMDDAITQTKRAIARYTYIKQRGMKLTNEAGEPTISLDRMPQVMNDRGKELEAQIRQQAPNVTPQNLARQVRGMLAKEFGLIQ